MAAVGAISLSGRCRSRAAHAAEARFRFPIAASRKSRPRSPPSGVHHHRCACRVRCADRARRHGADLQQFGCCRAGRRMSTRRLAATLCRSASAMVFGRHGVSRQRGFRHREPRSSRQADDLHGAASRCITSDSAKGSTCGVVSVGTLSALLMETTWASPKLPGLLAAGESVELLARLQRRADGQEGPPPHGSVRYARRGRRLDQRVGDGAGRRLLEFPRALDGGGVVGRFRDGVEIYAHRVRRVALQPLPDRQRRRPPDLPSAVPPARHRPGTVPAT